MESQPALFSEMPAIVRRTRLEPIATTRHRQLLLLSGMGCLPGQIDLFPTDGSEPSQPEGERMTTTATKLERYIANANGFENHYRHRFYPRLSYSDGVKYIAEEAGAYWLIDAIFSHSAYRRLQERCEGFEVWTLRRDAEGCGAVLSCSDGGMHGREPQIVARQRIEYTDFPLAELTLYIDGGILLLPNER